MDPAAQLEINMMMVLLPIIAGTVIFVLALGLFMPSRGKPKAAKVVVRQVRASDIQVLLDRAQMDITATEYIKRSLTFGIPVGIGLFLLIGSFTLFGVGILAGFMTTWTKLEQERDRKQVRYNKQLASACDTVRTAYSVNPSLKKALEAVAEYSQSPVKEDFQEILLAASQERFVEGLQEIADRRRSIVFDTVATSLTRASEASGEVNDMLQRLAESTRQNVGAFEDAITSQLNARSNIQWGTYGPWLIFCVFRLITVPMSWSAQGNLLGSMTTFFSTPGGNVLALFAAMISILVYRYCTNVSQRGLVVRRVAVTEPVVRMGQKPLSGQASQVNMNAQSRPVTLG